MEPDPIPTPELLGEALDVPLSPKLYKKKPEPAAPPEPVVRDPLPFRLLTPEQVAEVLQVTPDAVRRWLRTRRLRGIWIGRLWRIHPDDLSAFVQSMVPPPEELEEELEA